MHYDTFHVDGQVVIEVNTEYCQQDIIPDFVNM